MSENQAKTLSFKTNKGVSNAFDKLEAKIREVDSSLTRGDVLATVIQAAEKTIITEDNIKLATREELRLIEQHTQRLKDIYLSIFKRSEDYQLIADNKIKDLETKVLEAESTLMEEREGFKFELDLVYKENEKLRKSNEEILEKSQIIENSFLDKERTIKSLEEKIKELEEVRMENKNLTKENTELIKDNNRISNTIFSLEGEIKHGKLLNDRLEKDLKEKENEVKELNSKIQEIISEKENEKAIKIRKVTLEHRAEMNELKEEFSHEIQELNKKLVSTEVELSIIRLMKSSEDGIKDLEENTKKEDD